uniref:Fibronectin type-III domain-containing protein n=1 Tax=Astyanax mexicanus TaxID=7994 RepID=A0A8B9J8S4_ASTMX
MFWTVFTLILIVSAISVDVFSDVTVISQDMGLILKWNPPKNSTEQNFTYTAEFRSDGYQPFKTVCWSTSSLSCDFTDMVSAFGVYELRVRTEREGNSSDWIVKENIFLDKISERGLISFKFQQMVAIFTQHQRNGYKKNRATKCVFKTLRAFWLQDLINVCLLLTGTVYIYIFASHSLVFFPFSLFQYLCERPKSSLFLAMQNSPQPEERYHEVSIVQCLDDPSALQQLQQAQGSNRTRPYKQSQSRMFLT